jgi:hypothetical protein
MNNVKNKKYKKVLLTSSKSFDISNFGVIQHGILDCCKNVIHVLSHK